MVIRRLNRIRLQYDSLGTQYHELGSWGIQYLSLREWESAYDLKIQSISSYASRDCYASAGLRFFYPLLVLRSFFFLGYIISLRHAR